MSAAGHISGAQSAVAPDEQSRASRGCAQGQAHRLALDRAAAIAAAWKPEVAARFQRTLGALTRGIAEAGESNTVWHGGTLNGDGAPVEFTFSTLDDALRYTVEIVGPGIVPAARLDRIGQLLGEIGAPQAGLRLIEDFAALQGQGTLRWGGWLGVRHHPCGDAFKLYAEVPPDAADRAAPLLPDGVEPRLRLAGARQARIAAVGHTLGTDRREVYYALSPGAMTRAELAEMLAPVGLSGRAAALIDAARRLMIGGGRGGLPDIEYGLSLSTRSGGKEPVASLFAFAGELLGGDGIVRMQTLAAAERQGWSLGCYAAMTAPIARRIDRCNHHNVIAVIAGQKPVLGMHFSLSPPLPVPEGQP